MDYNNKQKVADKFLRGMDKYRDDKELLDFLEAYFMFMIQSDDLRKLNKEELNFTMDKLYGIIELLELLISDDKPEEETEEPIIENSTVNSLMAKVKKFF